jgi:hypothetical protein
VTAAPVITPNPPQPARGNKDTAADESALEHARIEQVSLRFVLVSSLFVEVTTPLNALTLPFLFILQVLDGEFVAKNIHGKAGANDTFPVLAAFRCCPACLHPPFGRSIVVFIVVLCVDAQW